MTKQEFLIKINSLKGATQTVEEFEEDLAIAISLLDSISDESEAKQFFDKCNEHFSVSI